MTLDPALLLEAAVRGMETGVAIQDERGRYLYVNEVLAGMHGMTAEEHAGITIEAALGPALGAQVLALHRQVLETGEPVVGADLEGAVPGVPDDVRRWKVGYRLVETGGQRAILTTVADVTAEYLAARRQESLAHLATAALHQTTVDRMLERALDALVDDLGVEMAGVFAVDHEAGTVRLRNGRGWGEGLVGSLEVPITPGKAFERAIASTEALVSADLDADPRFDGTPRALGYGLRAAAGLAIRVRGRAWAILFVGAGRPREFSAAAVQHVVAVAGLISVVAEREAHAAETTRRADERRRMVAATLASADAERRRIAEVLHDDLLQHLLFARQECQEGGGLERIAAALEDATRRLRGLIGEVHPVALSFTGLEPAVATLADELGNRGAFTVTTEIDDGDDGPLDTLVVGLVRELLTNVAKHAGAATAVVRVRREPEDLVLTVADDGCGLPAGATDPSRFDGHLGLASVVERVEAVGGTVDFGPGLRGRGTGVAVTLPR